MPLTQPSHTPAQQAHMRRIGWALFAYALILPPALWMKAHHLAGQREAFALALACSVPMVAIFVSWARYFASEDDEYHRAVVLRRAMAATHLTMGLAMVWGFLQDFGLLPLVTISRLPVVWVVMQSTIGLGDWFHRRGDA